jgi:hypothetical protein
MICKPSIMRSALTFVLIGIAAAALPGVPAWSASTNLVVTVNPGNNIAVTVNPTTETLTQNVTPTGDWTYVTSTPAWASSASDGWVYTPAGAAGCVSVDLTTFKGNYSATAYFTLNPVTAPLNVYVASSGSSCTTPANGPGTMLSSNSLSPTLLASGLAKSQSLYFYLLVTPVGGQPIAGTTTITITFTAN